MKKLFAVLKREYLQTVRKPSFLVMTLLAPFLMGALMFIPSLIALKGLGEKKVAVIDGTGRLAGAVGSLTREEPTPAGDGRSAFGDKRQGGAGRIVPEYVAATGADPKAEAAPYLERLTSESVPKARRLDGVLLVPAGAFEDPSTRLVYYSRSATDFLVQERLGRLVNRALARQRLTARGLDPKELDGLLADLRVDSVQVTRSGRQKKGGEANFLVAMVFLVMLFFPALLYGQEVMRGVIQEKTDRIVEILISSMTPMELLSGKILGMAAIGLTQVAVWIAMGAGMALYAAQGVAAAGIEMSTFLRPSVAVSFTVFFVLGYLIYVCVYAAGGAMVNSEKEAQQVLTPVVLILMVPWFLVMPILMSPDSPMSVALSLFPLYTPTTMFVRILVSEPPAWQVAASIALSVATVWGMLWTTAKVFRVGLLSYGKRPTVQELWRWLKVA